MAWLQPPVAYFTSAQWKCGSAFAHLARGQSQEGSTPSPTLAATLSPLPNVRPEGGPWSTRLTRSPRHHLGLSCVLPAVTPWGARSGWLVTKGKHPTFTLPPRASPGWADVEGPSPIAPKSGAFAPQGACTLSYLGTRCPRALGRHSPRARCPGVAPARPRLQVTEIRAWGVEPVPPYSQGERGPAHRI